MKIEYMERITDYCSLLQDSVRRTDFIKMVNRMLETCGKTVSTEYNSWRVEKAVAREYEKKYISSEGVKTVYQYEVGLLGEDGRFYSFDNAGEGVDTMDIDEVGGTIEIRYVKEPTSSLRISFSNDEPYGFESKKMNTTYLLKELIADSSKAVEFVKDMNSLIPDGGRCFVDEFHYVGDEAKTGLRAECTRFLLEYTAVRYISEDGSVEATKRDQWEIRTEDRITDEDFHIAHTFDITNADTIVVDHERRLIEIQEVVDSGAKHILKVLEPGKVVDFSREMFGVEEL